MKFVVEEQEEKKLVFNNQVKNYIISKFYNIKFPSNKIHNMGIKKLSVLLKKLLK